MYTPDHEAEIRNSSACTCRPKIKTSDSAHMGMLPGTYFHVRVASVGMGTRLVQDWV